MAIKISPSQIFGITHTAVPLNSYGNVSVDERNYVVEFDNVSESKTFTFYEKQVDISEDGTTKITVKDVVKNNKGATFYDDSWTELANTGRAVTAIIPLNITQKTKLNTNVIDTNYIEITSHYLRRETRIFDAVVSGDRIIGGEEYTVVSFDMPFKAKNTSNALTIEVDYWTHILQTTVSYPNKVKYILSETISIEGQCIKETEPTVAKYDEEAIVNNILKLPTNELIQGGNYYGDISTNYSDKFIAEVYDKYKNGKETATLLCLVGKYYDLEGNLVVDADNEDESIPPLLKKYDLVVPYIHTSNGEVPLSTDKDGNAKQFQIIGVNFRYRGIARQEIVIQEYAP
jgi:hypothetical protein